MYRRDLRETDRDRLPADMAIAEEIVQVVPEPGGERLAYACAREDRLDLWLATNGEDRRLTSEGIAALRYGRTDSRWFGWAPDGESLAYASAEGELWRVGTESGEKHRLTRHEATEAEPRWSPDGDRLACVTDYWSPTGLAALEADGSGLACLRADEYHYSDPRWADRETLYAVRSRHRDLFDYEAEIARIDVTGDCEVLFAESGVRAYAPRPRPESEGVAFVHDASGFDALYLADPRLSEQASGEGSNDGIEQLYATDGTEVGAPAWDSSGERLAVTTTREGSVGIDVVGRDGESRELPTDPGRRHAPAWHDGAVVCVESTPRRPAWVVERGADAATDADTSANADVEAAGTGRTLAGTVPVGFEERLREPEARTYEAPDGREVHAMVYLPDGIDERADESLLLLVHSHGGPTDASRSASPKGWSPNSTPRANATNSSATRASPRVHPLGDRPRRLHAGRGPVREVPPGRSRRRVEPTPPRARLTDREPRGVLVGRPTRTERRSTGPIGRKWAHIGRCFLPDTLLFT